MNTRNGASSLVRWTAAGIAAVLAVGAIPLLSAGCPATPKVDPGLVQLTTSVDHPVILAGKPGEVVLKIEVEALQPPRAARPPLNLAIVIDTSGSMEGEPIDAAKAAVADVLGRLHEGDYAVLVGFGSVATVLGKGEWDSDSAPDDLVAAVDKIAAAGTTDMRAGLTAAFDQTAERRDSSHLSRIILLSDGKPNDPTGLVDMAYAAASQQMPIIAFGLGIEFDETLLAEMARNSGGNYAFLSGADQIAQRFQEEILKLETIVARNVSLEIVPGPNIDVLEVPGWDDLSPERDVILSLGDLVGGKKREVLLRLAHGERSHEARVELADVRLRYLDSYGGSGFQEKVFYVGIRATEDETQVDTETDAAVTDALAEVRANVFAMRAAEDMRRGDLASAGQTLATGIEIYRRTYEDVPEEELSTRDDYARLRTLDQAVRQADPVLADRTREEARRALDEGGIGAVNLPGARTTATGTGGLGGEVSGALGGAQTVTTVPAAAPAPAYEFDSESTEQILEVHSGAFRDLFGN